MNFKLCRISGRLSTAEGSILCTISNKKRVISIDYHQNSHVIKGAELYTTIRQDIKILSEQTADMDLEQYRNTALAPLLDKIEQNKKTDKDGQDYKDNKLAGLTPTRHSWTKAGQTLFP